MAGEERRLRAGRDDGDEQIADLEENLASSLVSGDGRSTNTDTGAQIFSSLPSFIDAASFLTSCFTGSLEEYFMRETNMRQLEMVSISGDQESDSFSNSLTSTSDVVNSRQNQETQSSTSLFQSLITRARKTVHGSADDIGWLERAEGMPPVEDGTQRFTELLDKIKKNEHQLPDSVVYLLVPGLFSNHGRMYFVNIKKNFSKMGLACHIAKTHSEASVEKNAREIKEYIDEIYWGAKKKVLLFGHSKGGVDSAAALALYWAELKDKVAGLVLAQSPFAGSPIASDILRPGQLGDYVNLRKITEFLFCKILKITFPPLVKVLMGLSPGEDLDLLREQFHEFVQGLISLPIRLPGTRFSKSFKAKEIVENIISKIVEGKALTGQPGMDNDVVDLLVNEVNGNNTCEISMNSISSIITELMIPGEHSVPMMMTLALKYLSDAPSALEQVREENLALRHEKVKSGEPYAWADYMSLTFTHYNGKHSKCRMAEGHSRCRSQRLLNSKKLVHNGIVQFSTSR